MLKFDFIYKKMFFYLFLYLLLLKELIFKNLFWRNIPIQILFLTIFFLQIIKKNYRFIYKIIFPIDLQRKLSYYFYSNKISIILFKKYQFNYYLGKWFCNFYLKSNLLVFIWKRNYAIVLFRKWFFFCIFF